MPKAPQRCRHDCPNIKGQCEEHRPKRIPWKGSTRKDSGFLDSAEWRRQKRRVLHRANKLGDGCELKISPECTVEATQVDHKIPVWYTRVDKVEDDELQGVCAKCHQMKSSYEGVQAKRIHALKHNQKGYDGFI